MWPTATSSKEHYLFHMTWERSVSFWIVWPLSVFHGSHSNCLDLGWSEQFHAQSW